MNYILFDNLSYDLLEMNNTSRLLINHAALKANILGPDNLEKSDVELFKSIILNCIVNGNLILKHIDNNSELCEVIARLSLAIN